MFLVLLEGIKLWTKIERCMAGSPISTARVLKIYSMKFYLSDDAPVGGFNEVYSNAFLLHYIVKKQRLGLQTKNFFTSSLNFLTIIPLLILFYSKIILIISYQIPF